MEPLRRVRAAVEAWFGRLAPRERVLVSAAGVALLVFLFALAFAAVGRSAALHQSAIDRKTEVLAQVGKLAQTYRATQAERAGLESRLRGPPLQLMSHVAQTGQRLGIEVTDLRPGTGDGAPAEGLTEETVEVSLAGVEIAKVTSFLQELERGPGVVKIRRLALRARNDAPTSVDVTFVAATYRLAGKERS